MYSLSFFRAQEKLGEAKEKLNQAGRGAERTAETAKERLKDLSERYGRQLGSFILKLLIEKFKRQG